MAFVQTKNVEIKGLSACVPERVVRNDDYPYLSKEEIDKYISTIGVVERHCTYHDGEICTSDLCYASAEKLISELKWDKNEIELLIFVSHTADYKLPSTACILQNRLGLPTSSMAFDSPLGCSGFVYGMCMATALMQTGGFRKGLLLVGNTQSFYAAPKDQGTSLLFADAGTAIALEYKDGSDSSFEFNLYTDGGGKDSLIVPDGGCRNPFTDDSLSEFTDEDGVVRTKLHEKMDGLEVFSFATTKVPKSIMSLRDHFNIDFNGINYLLLHQANKFLCEKIRKRLKFDIEHCPYNIDRFGNTSGASIPLLMLTELSDELKTKKLQFIASGFGVGLSLASMHFSTDRIVVTPLLTLKHSKDE